MGKSPKRQGVTLGVMGAVPRAPAGCTLDSRKVDTLIPTKVQSGGEVTR